MWQSDRNAYSAIGGNGDGAAALCGAVSRLVVDGAHDPTHGSCQRPWPAISRSAAAGPPDALRVGLDRRRRVEQRLHDPPRLLDAVLAREARGVAVHGGEQQHLVGRRPLAALVGELHVEVDLLGLGRVAALGLDEQPHAGRRVELDDELHRLGLARRARRGRPAAAGAGRPGAARSA